MRCTEIPQPTYTISISFKVVVTDIVIVELTKSSVEIVGADFELIHKVVFPIRLILKMRRFAALPTSNTDFRIALQIGDVGEGQACRKNDNERLNLAGDREPPHLSPKEHLRLGAEFELYPDFWTARFADPFLSDSRCDCCSLYLKGGHKSDHTIIVHYH